LKAQLGRLPKAVIADVGYGGEENYVYLEHHQVEALIKYSTYHQENSKAWKKEIGKIENWTYNEEEDAWTCAVGQTFHFWQISKESTESGYAGCEGCPLKSQCTRTKGDHEIKVSMKCWRLKSRAREKLKSEKRL